MLVIAPIAILVIGAIITFMVSLAGDSLIARQHGSMAFSIQNAQSRIEQDARLSTQFLDAFKQIDTVDQSKNGASLTSGFSTATGDIIFNQFATTQNPSSPNRNVVYYKNRPNACGTSTTYLNQPLTVKIIYTIGNYDGKGNSLWRRTIVPSWSSSTSTNNNAVCSTPWHRDSCKVGSTNGAFCQTIDEKILSDVSNMTVSYFLEDGSATTDVRAARQIKVALTTSSTTAGETVSNYALMRARHINIPVDDIPSKPVVYINNPTISSWNNTILATFAWDTSKYANYYNVRWRLNGGAWYSLNGTTTMTKAIDKTSFGGTEIGAGDQIQIGVTAGNDQGLSPETILSYRLPTWTALDLEGDYDRYNSSFYGSARFTRTSAGLILVDGLVKNDSLAVGDVGQIAVLPAGFRPATTVVFPSWCASNAMCRIQVTSGGVLQHLVLPGSSAAWVSLSPIQYLASDKFSTAVEATKGPGFDYYSSGTSSFGRPWLNLDECKRTHTNGLMSTTAAWTPSTWQYISSRPSAYAALSAYWPYPSIAYSTSGGHQYLQLGIYSSNVTYNIAANNGAALTTNSWLSTNSMVLSNSYSDPFVNMTPPAGYVPYSGGYIGPVATKASSCDGIVTLGGTMKATSPGAIPYNTKVGKVPAAYGCPSKTLVFMTAGHDGTALAPMRIDVTPTGDLIVNRGGNASNMVSFGGISYLADNPSCT